MNISLGTGFFFVVCVVGVRLISLRVELNCIILNNRIRVDKQKSPNIYFVLSVALND